MKTMKKLTAIFAVLAITVSCSKLDVVGSYSIRSFDELLQNAPELVSQSKAFYDSWSISAPDNSVWFHWSRHFADSPIYDLMLVIAADPFIAAGLDPSKLPSNYIFQGGFLIVGTNLGNEKLSYERGDTPLASYEQIVKLSRSSIGYHGQLDHYGISLGDGNMFEWAKNVNTNDKDIVFVLAPEPFIAAGVDVSRLDGWAFAKVTVDDANGKPIQVDKLLKPFNLR